MVAFYKAKEEETTPSAVLAYIGAAVKGLCTPPSYCPTHRGGHVAERIDKICLDRKTFHTFDTPTTYQLHDFPGFSRIWRVRWCSW
jgi:hypothetical protein